MHVYTVFVTKMAVPFTLHTYPPSKQFDIYFCFISHDVFSFSRMHFVDPQCFIKPLFCLLHASVSHLQVTLSDSTNSVDCSPDDVLMVNITVVDLSPIFDPMDSKSIDEGTGVDTSVVQVMIIHTYLLTCLFQNISLHHNSNRKPTHE